MVYRKYTACALCGLILLISPIRASAETAVDLYNFYGVSFHSDLPEDVYNTIQDYQEAQRLAQQYRYVQGVYLDSIKTTSTTRDRLSEVAQKLKDGYSLPIEEIQRLEILYKDLLVTYEKEVSASNEQAVASPISEDFKTPTYSEYKKALAIQAEYNTRMNIGDISELEYPLASAALIEAYDDQFIKFITAEGNSVLALFNGEVADVGDDYVVLDCYNGIRVSYTLINPGVRVGQTVYQGKVIGTTDKYVNLFLKLGDTNVSPRELFLREEGKNYGEVEAD